MTTITSLSDDRFRSLFRDFRKSAFRLETLQVYDVSYEREDFESFLAGQARGEVSGISGYAERVRAGTAAGKRFHRVHVVEEPLSDYVRFEAVWSYRETVAAGEDVRVIPVRRGEWPDGIPRLDYWLFDSALLVVMNYAEDGLFLSAQLSEEPDRVAEAVRWRDHALALSQPFSDYAQDFDELMRRR
ncbi:DUF6879 family protein [Actinomadura adrarensis]|uniref:DUF6879 family protein n=1 Tax=Actinomadura adrarensis TaxID=1819600 RepID=A0ABW3CTK4_9ACTN